MDNNAQTIKDSQGSRGAHITIKPQNDDLNRNIRRYQVRLKVTAAGVMILALWSFIKSGLLIASGNDRSFTDLRDMFNGLSQPEVIVSIILTSIIVLFFFSIDLFFRMWIYKGARRESRGLDKKHKNGYLVVTVFMILLSVVVLALIVYTLFFIEDERVEDNIVSIIIEITNLVTLIEVIISAVRLRRLRAQRDDAARPVSTEICSEGPESPENTDGDIPAQESGKGAE